LTEWIKDEAENPGTVFNDNLTVVDVGAALASLWRAYPTLLGGREFYVTGESYAGIYIPAVSLHLMDLLQQGSAGPFHGLGFNFQGFAIGNGELSSRWNDATFPDFGYFHGIISHNWWLNYKRSCCDPPGDVICPIAQNDACLNMIDDMLAHYSDTMIHGHSDPYNVYQLCYELPGDTHFPFAATLNASLSSMGESNGRWAQLRMQMAAMRSKTDSRPSQDPSSTSMPQPFDGQQQQLMFNYGSNDGSAGYPCSGADMTNAYLQQRYVREALHVPDYVQPWTECA
jgi:Serine carboxypeptidase